MNNRSIRRISEGPRPLCSTSGRVLYGRNGAMWKERCYVEGRVLYGRKGATWKEGCYMEGRVLYGRKGAI